MPECSMRQRSTAHSIAAYTYWRRVPWHSRHFITCRRYRLARKREHGQRRRLALRPASLRPPPRLLRRSGRRGRRSGRHAPWPPAACQMISTHAEIVMKTMLADAAKIFATAGIQHAQKRFLQPMRPSGHFHYHMVSPATAPMNGRDIFAACRPPHMTWPTRALRS